MAENFSPIGYRTSADSHNKNSKHNTFNREKIDPISLVSSEIMKLISDDEAKIIRLFYKRHY